MESNVPSVRREMFIDAKRNDAALRQEGHVNGEGKMLKIYMALLTEGGAVASRVL